MEYLAHMDKERKQTVKEHLEGTAQLAGKFAGVFEKQEWGYCCGLLHDIGKYSSAFQEHIRGKKRQVDHSTAGAQLCMEKGGYYELMSYCIAGHHTGLPDLGSTVESGSLKGRMIKKIEDYQAYKKEITIPELKSPPFAPNEMKNPYFSLSVLIRMLYSCLVDADFLDTERFMEAGENKRESGEGMNQLLEKLEGYIGKWQQQQDVYTVNGRRSYILNHCLRCGEMERGIFSLTVPTGGGKTIDSLAFALRHAVNNHMERIIYVIPYTSIIEQNAAVFREILGDENVLENHCNVTFEENEELKSIQLAAENWDKPVVVTTNVQFFESLFSNRSSRCRKLHNIANSVIIFDEAQMLPTEYLQPCIAMMEELVLQYKASIVLCTATQPALKSFLGSATNLKEICPEVEEQFEFFERVTYCDIGIISEDGLAQKLSEEDQALCIVNTKKRAQHIYEKLKGEGIYHLSTTMYPKHRKFVLAEIRKRLREKKRCILISTSLVEAGVDLDFEAVYRQLAGIDSMIQAAGRCNREGKRAREESKVSIFQFAEPENVIGQKQQMQISKLLLNEGYNVASLECVEEYFKRLYHFKGQGLDKKKIMDEFGRTKFNFAKVGREFKLIEQQTKTIFIPIEDEAKQLLAQMKYQGYTKTGMRKAGQYCVQVYERVFEKLFKSGMIQPVSENIEDFYELQNMQQYTDEMGLVVSDDSGEAFFI